MGTIKELLGITSWGPIKAELFIFCLVFSFILGLLISLIYRKANQGFSYESSFNFTLILTCMI